MVQFKDVSKVYPGNIMGISDINVKIEPGEFVFLIGPSGSGKTTLLKMLIRDEKPSSGKIYFNDEDITNISRRKIYKLRRQVGVVFQDFKLIPDKTAWENVAFAMEAAGKKNKEINERVPYVLDIVGLSNRIKSFPRQLSGGEQQRVAIARALANNPKIIIADEPTGNLDPGSAWDIVQILTKINNWGTTVIMTTHGTDIVNALNKRVIQMENGKVVRDDNKGEYEFRSEFEKKIMDEPKHEELLKKPSFKVNLTSSLKENTTENLFDQKKQSKKKFRLWPFGKKTTTSEFVDELKHELETEPVSSNIESEKSETTENILVDSSLSNEPKLNFGLHVDLETSLVSTPDSKETPKPIKKQTSLKKAAKKVKKKSALKVNTDELKKEFEEISELDNSEEKSKNILIQALDLPSKLKGALIMNGYETVSDIIHKGPEKLGSDLGLSEAEIIKIAKSIEETLK